MTKTFYARRLMLNNWLPTKFRERYEIVYRKFIDQKLQNNIKSFSENVFLTYFEELSNQIKTSSLWSINSMLHTNININHDDINIAIYSKLLALLKQKSDEFKSKKSKTLSTKKICDFLENAPDRQFLFMKVNDEE